MYTSSVFKRVEKRFNDRILKGAEALALHEPHGLSFLEQSSEEITFVTGYPGPKMHDDFAKRTKLIACFLRRGIDPVRGALT